MDEMKDFVLWCLEEIPAVLLEPPISAFVGIALLVSILRVLYQMMHIAY